MSLTEVLLFFVFSFVVFVVSIPIHELCHLIAIKSMGSKTKAYTKWFNTKFAKRGDEFFMTFGYLRPLNDSGWHLPPFFIKRYKFAAFIFGISGGIGCALLLVVLLWVARHLVNIPSLAVLSIVVIALSQALYGLIEGTDLSRSVNVATDGNRIVLIN